MMFRKLLIAGLMVSASAFAATAADAIIPTEEAPLVSSFSWTGFYVGVQGGYGFGSADHTFDNGAPSDDSDPDGFLGGVHVGYNYQMDQFVFGAEADVEYSDIEGSFENLTGITSQGATEINWQGSIRARLGVAMDRTLIYATGGVAFADVDYSGGPAGGPVCCGYSETRTGWTIGGGAEHAFTDKLTARIEYRFTDFGEADDALNPAFPDVDMATDLDIHAVRVGLSYKF